MSLDNIDEEFDKVAKKIANNSSETKPTSQNEENASSETQTEKYENSAKSNVSPLLSLFASHLKNQKTNTETDSEFRTVDLSEVGITPNTNHSPKDGTDKVSEEEINKLLNITPPNKSIDSIKQQTSVQDVVYTQGRYSDLHTPPQNVASFDDLSIKYVQNDNNASGPNISPSSEDAQAGFKPVNVSENYKNKQKNSEMRNSEKNNTETSHTQTDNIDADVLKKISKHKEKKKNISECDGTLKDDE